MALPLGKLNRTEWRLRRRQENLGDFATAIDKVLEEKDNLTLDLFFQVVAQWAGVDDDESDSEDKGETDWSLGSPQHHKKGFSSAEEATGSLNLMDVESK